MPKSQKITRSLISFYIASLILGCGKGNQEGCDHVIGSPQAYPNSQNNYSCPTGMILVGFNPNAVNGPLLCATLTVSCPVPEK